MTDTVIIVSILITALAIYIDKITLFKHDSLPAIAFAGIVAIIASMVA